MKIVAIDDKPINNQVIKLDCEEFFEDLDVDIDFESYENPLTAIKEISENGSDIVFVDYMMPLLDGMETIEKIKKLGLLRLPKIIMVTALNSFDTREKAYSAGVDYFIAKPFCNKEIYNVLELLLSDKYDKNNFFIKPSDISEEDIFLDFDNDFNEEFIDFDENISFVENSKELMSEFNKSHKMLSAEDFFNSQPSIENYYQELNDINDVLEDYLNNLEASSLTIDIYEIIEIIDIYENFFNKFSDFKEISAALIILKKILINTRFIDMEFDKKNFVAKYIVAILDDLMDWKINVLEKKDAVDIFYINASLLNSCIQLEGYLKGLK